jgi:glycolate dehydrogenase FAD-binding subunit
VTAVLTAARPADAVACAAMLAEAADARRTVRIRGAGTKDHLGELVPADVTLETTAMKGVVDHVPADLTVTISAGTPFADVQRALGMHGQFLPLDPPHADAATVGGIVAANSNGFGRVRYGGVRDLLIGIEVALADGTIANAGGRVVKNVAGYDLDKLFIGSLGTLGVITQATFKVLPLPTARAVAIARCASAVAAFEVVDALLHMPLRPSALVVEGTRDGWTLVVAAEGDGAPVERAMSETARLARASGAAVDRPDDPAVLAPLRELPGTATDGALVRAALPLAAQRSFVESAARLDGFARSVTDAGSAIVRVHLRGDPDAIVRSADTLLAGAVAVGGSARIERRDDALRSRLRAWGVSPAGDFLMRRIKERFDPAGILEPGRSILG